MNNQTEIFAKIREEIGKVVVGKEDIIDKCMAAILAKGHILLEDVPGVGKTTLALAFSRVLSLEYNRLQFTPDVLPSDVTGFSMYNRKLNDFEYKKGAAMTNLLLADEINRTSPKTQSALLELMEEGTVTVEAVTYELPKPFIVMATQNPSGYIGTQNLPESQVDRFMIKLSMGYPDFESELMIYKGNQRAAMDDVLKVITKEELINMQKEVDLITVKDNVIDYMTQIIRKTREDAKIELGLSPRGGIALLNMAKATAYMQGRNYVIPEDINVVIDTVCLHRIVLSGKAKADRITKNEILRDIVSRISIV